jgi:alpha-beta hydrolase superfamily lysophospholipase
MDFLGERLFCPRKPSLKKGGGSMDGVHENEVNLFVCRRREFLKKAIVGAGGCVISSALAPLGRAKGESKEPALFEESFSFDELKRAGRVAESELGRLRATDGVELAYRSYVPATPRAIVLFFHGGGAHSGAGYQHLGSGLRTEFDIAVFMPDLRGHGASGGPRGDTPSPNQVWQDITSCIRHIRKAHPRLPLFLGGHSSGAGLALNYAGQEDREPVEGYVFLSPQLGFRSETDRPSPSEPFARVDTGAFVGYAMSGGREHGHDYAVKFNYPLELLKADPGMVPAITVNMSMALTPASPREQFAALDRPFGLWIGSEDELFVADRVLAYGELAASVRSRCRIGAVTGKKHLSILLGAHEMIGSWVMSMVNS